MIKPSADGLTVSVLVANFNYGRFLGAAIESVLAQSRPVQEILVCDDGSTDDSCTVAERYAARHDRVKLLRKTNGGQGSAFNTAFAASSGQIVCLLDSDDVLAEHKVARVVDVFAAMPEVGWVRHKLRLADESLAPLEAVLPAFRGSRKVRGKYAHLEKTVTFNAAVSLRRELAERLFPIPEHAFRRGPDLYLDFMCGVLGATGYSLDQELGLYRRHSAQVSASGGDFQAALEAEIGMTRAFLSVEPCQGYIPTHLYKHEMVAAYMRSGHILDRRRLALCAGGLASAGRMAKEGSAGLALLQLAKLAYGFLLPRSWIRRQRKRNAWCPA
ncbi:MAG TPA: glycosyltransferase [Bryobacteraceae bacterium]|nr:glycosyltransferase [Bryobacteraceae bacterium]